MQHFHIRICALVLAISSPLAVADKPTTKLVVGDFPPRYVGRELGGPDLTLDPNSGKAYVISFWASWCGPCLQELPILANIQAIAGTDKMVVVAVNIDELDVYRRLRRPVQEAGLTSTFDPDRKAREAYGVGTIPHMVIIGGDGRISAIRIGYSKSTHEELAAALNRALAAEPVGAPPTEAKPAATQ